MAMGVESEEPGNSSRAFDEMSATLHPVDPLLHDLIPRQLAQMPPRILYHYTRPAAVIEICNTRTMLAGTAADMNDMREQKIAVNECESLLMGGGDRLLPFLDLWRECRDEGTLSSLYNSVFTVSFTEQEDALEQWRAYGAENGAMALGFTSDHLRRSAESQGFWMGPCIYDHGEQMDACRRLVEWVTPKALATTSGTAMGLIAASFQAAVLDLGVLLKDEGFASEREWRLISPFKSRWPERRMHFSPGNRGIRQFVKFDLYAGCDPADEEAVFLLGPNGDTRSMLQASDGLAERLGAGSTIWGYSGSTYRL